MLLLSFDTSNNTSSVAIIDNGKTIYYHIDSQPNRQAEKLLSFIDEALRTTQTDWALIDGVIIPLGPGSFTGIRIGIASAKGLCLPNGTPLYGVNCLMAQAWNARPNASHDAIHVFLDARRNQAYHQLFSHKLVSLTTPALIEQSDIPDIIKKSPSSHVIYPSDAPMINANLLGLCAYWCLTNDHALAECSTNITPLYIRPPDAKPAMMP